MSLFLPAICSSVSWSACVGGKRMGQKITNKLLNKDSIPNPKLFRHYIPCHPRPETTTQLNTGCSVQGSVGLSAGSPSEASTGIYSWDSQMDPCALNIHFLSFFFFFQTKLN